jgi:hypothetical protein
VGINGGGLGIVTLVEHARRELELLGQFAQDPAYAQSIVAAVAAFASYGHSGGSAGCAVEQLTTLLQYRTLTPLTDDPDDWHHHGEDIAGVPGGLWQNRRDPAVFSADGGKTYYFVDGRLPGIANPRTAARHVAPAEQPEVQAGVLGA